MKKTETFLPYGNSSISLFLPDNIDVLSTSEPSSDIDKDEFVTGLEKLIESKGKISGQVAVIVADKTRLCGYDYAIQWLLEGLKAKGINSDQIIFYIAYGTHKRQSEEECLLAYGETYNNYTFIHHDCIKHEKVHIGTTTRGTNVQIRKDILEAELIITFGAVSHHYFAGFGGGRKLLFPGLAGRQGIYQNHSLFLDKDTNQLAQGCRPGNLKNNPLSDDLEEINRLLPTYSSIHGLLNSSGKVVSYFFGSSYEDFLSVCDKQNELYKVENRKQYDLVIASAGGLPKDINFIQAHKALHNCARFVKDNGTLLLVAECKDQLGSNTFLPYFTMGSFNEAFTHLCSHYVGNGGTALAMMEKIKRIKINMVTSLEAETCETMGVIKTSPEGIEKIINNTKGTVAIIANGSMLI